MPAKETETPEENLTLDPLFDDGPDALDTHDTPALAGARLTEVHIRWKNLAYGVTIRKAEDLFALQPPGAPIVPKAATITSATFHLSFPDSIRPHKVTIQPPHRVIFEFPSDAPRVNPWLDKRHYRISANIIRTCTAILLAIASALAPALGDGDGDEDDLSSERRALRA